MERVRAFMRNVKNVILRPEMRVLPGQLAFFFVLSFIPIIALVGTIASYFGVSVASLKSILSSSVPSEIAETLVSFVSGKGLNFNIIIFFVSAFVLASNGAHSVIITSNEIYKVEDRGILKRRLKAILMTFLLVILIFFLLAVPVFGDMIFNILKTYATNGSQQGLNFAYQIYEIIKYPVSIFIIYVIVKFLYTIAPDTKIETKTTTYGAIFTAITWAISTAIYSFYVETFTHYDLFYGSISNIIILFLWVYLLAYIFVLGMALNTGNANKDELKTEIIKTIDKKEYEKRIREKAKK